MHIAHTDLEIQREPFARPFGFKGSAFHEKFNAVVRVRDAEGIEAFGLGGLAVLWSDPTVFAAHTEMGGNVLMIAMLEYALQAVKNRDYDDPIVMFEDLLPKVHEYGKTVTQNPDLRLTFTLNALVGLDSAAWMLYAKQNGITTFDALIPPPYRPYLARKRDRIAIVPAVGYTLPMESVKDMLNDGVFVLKIKIGHPGSEAEMVALDIDWLTTLHEIAQSYSTPMTDSGRVAYYLDANGRYGQKESMRRLLDHAEKAGMLERIILIEEPFEEGLKIDVSDLPARFAADESLHTIEDVQQKVEAGYGAIAIKPAGKTLSLAFQMVQAATEAGAIAFVADNACVPILVEWNKNISARLPAFPGVKAGIMESNGPQNYSTWHQLLQDHPCAGASWLKPELGAFVLDDDYYQRSGGIFLEPRSYSKRFR